MLKGVRVLELANLLPGPLAGKMLQSLGADVTKIEPPAGDPVRHFEFVPKAKKKTGEALFDSFNRGKTLAPVRLDFHKPEHQEKFREHLSESDVLIYSLKPSSLDFCNLSPFDIRREFPSKIVCCITGFGLRGPLSSRGGHDLTYLARSGVLGAMNQRTMIPFALQVADIAAGTQPAVIQILAALVRKYKNSSINNNKRKENEEKEKDGDEGALIDVAMTDCSRSLSLGAETCRLDLKQYGIDTEGGHFFLAGKLPCYRFYLTSDSRAVAVGCLEFPYWKKFVSVINAPAEFASTPQKQFAAGKTGAEIVGVISRIIEAKPFTYWRELFEKNDCMAEVVLNAQEAADSQHFQKKGKHQQQQHEEEEEEEELWNPVNSPFRFL